MNQAERRVWLINALLNERQDGRDIVVPAGAEHRQHAAGQNGTTDEQDHSAFFHNQPSAEIM